jgi:hypothetical protein
MNIKRRMTSNEMLYQLREEKIYTWFDLGLFLDRVKEYRSVPAAEFRGSYEEFNEYIGKGEIAFVTFGYSVDGVTIEIEKYAKTFRKNYTKIKIHYIGGFFKHESEKIIDPRTKKFVIKEACGFDNWDLYKDFFYTKLERGSPEYNALITKFWKQVLYITEKLGKYIEENNIQLIFAVNICSNPGNVSLALAIVLVSEYLGIPVISNNHDFYWEGGNRPVDIKVKGLKPGPRDFFFTNSHVGEFFSQIEVLFPWESRSWISVNINYNQNRHLIKVNGHNPANIKLLGTAIDTEEFTNTSKRKKINTFYQFEKVLSRYEKTLVAYSAKDVLERKLVNEYNPRPILIGYRRTKPIEHFLAENIIFLQPTRIISRKRIEVGFTLINKLLKYSDFIEKFRETKHLKITMLITGPIALGHYKYFEELLKRFSILLNEIDKELRDKIYVAFLFCELDKEKFINKFENPVGITELYNIASLVLLPSQTEGRGLPIIESTACGTPIFCSRYFPEDVYSNVIGEYLPEEDRLKVIEYDGEKIKTEHVKSIFERVFFPDRFVEEITHNKKAVQKRYSLKALNENIKEICYTLYLQLKPNNKCLYHAEKAIEKYKKINNTGRNNKDLQFILKTKKRHYLPGFGRLTFMLNLKSLIDPSFFRVEEKEIRGMAFTFARELIENDPEKELIEEEKIGEFYNAVDSIFLYQTGEIKIRHDHSFSYRHRNKKYYPYQEFTVQELTGIINMLYFDIIKPEFTKKVDTSAHFFTDWNLALSQMTSSTNLAIDDRKELLKRMHENKPIGIFSGLQVKYELEFFALQSVRSRLDLSIEEELTEDLVEKNARRIEPVYLFAQEKSVRRWPDANEIIKHIKDGNDAELKLLFKYGLLQVVKTKQLCVGIHFAQLGEKPLKILRKIKEKKGFIISLRSNAIVMTDIVDIDRFHIGRAKNPITATIMGIPEESGYIQFVPAGVRTTLAYPTPIQTARDFSEALKSDIFKELTEKLGEEKVYEAIKKDAEEKGSPVNFILQSLVKGSSQKKEIDYSFVSGVYRDGLPWNGVIANVNTTQKGKKWQFKTLSSTESRKRVTEFICDFEKTNNKKARIGWNGGYILNPELVGKLGLPESYIGSPLGLLISENKVICPPLFNKAALLIYPDGKMDIKRVNLTGGIVVSDVKTSVELNEENYNVIKPGIKTCYYDLLFTDREIEGDERIILRLAGNVVKEIIRTKKKEKVEIIPVGLTLSFKKENFPDSFAKVGKELTIRIKEYEGISHAVEAGPMLVDEGKKNINMEMEGWKSRNSIKTQAARLDYTDMRGPKIAAGLDKSGNLVVLAINGRIRESVGATHVDMAEILTEFKIQKAMGFDPGGSSTLVVDGKTLNISPYNSQYEKNIYSLPPEPRAVANAVIGYIE